jgi:hypothetical protein
MTVPSLDVALNLLWASIALCLFSLLWRQELRGLRPSGALCRTRRLCAVIVAGVCLFPAVSYSDDLFFFAFLDSQLHSRDGVGSEPAQSEKRDSLRLYRALQGLEDCRPEAVQQLTSAPHYFATVLESHLSAPHAHARCRPGRAPPAF